MTTESRLRFPYPRTERILVLLNPKAAGGQPASLRRRIGGAFAAAEVPFEIYESDSPEDGLRAARYAADHGYRAVAAAGGDGTIALALRGTAGSDTPVAVLPLGTGNQLALNFGVPVSLEDAIKVAVDGVPEQIDLGKIGDEYFALMSGAGLDADVMAGATSDLKARLGILAYLYSGLKTVIVPKSVKFKITADDHELEIAATMVLIANVGLLGAGTLPVELKVAPKSSFQDGLLDVAVFAPRHLPDWAGILWRVAREQYEGDERMIFLQARKVSVVSDPPIATQIDGEPRGPTPIEAEVIPGAARILVPR